MRHLPGIKKDSRRQNKTVLITGIVLVTTVIVLVVLMLVRFTPFFNSSRNARLYTLWEQGKFEAVADQTSVILLDTPMSMLPLTLRGFSNLHLGINQTDHEKRELFLNDSISSMRQALLLPNNPHRSQIYYMLGVAYFNKGKYYFDTAEEYFLKALDTRTDTATIHEYLSLIYAEMELYGKSIPHIEKALSQVSSIRLELKASELYFSSGNLNKGESLLTAVLETNDIDPELIVQARMLLGRMLLERKAYIKAEEEFDLVLELDPDNADAHYYKGEVNDLLHRDSALARKEWRTAYKLDPSHIKARKRLYE